MKKLFTEIWKKEILTWRHTAALMKTRGFWCVQVVWFVAGGFFFRLLPTKPPEVSWLNYGLNVVLICVILLPIYFSVVTSWSAGIDRWIDRIRKLKP